jgi:hypothetical protein
MATEVDDLEIQEAPPEDIGTAPPTQRGGDDSPPPSGPPIRLAVAVGFPVVGAAVMVGGIFNGASPRPYAAIAGMAGVALGVVASRIQRRPFVMYATVLLGLLGIGLLLLFPDVGAMFKVSKLVKGASHDGNLLRPPVPFIEGWKPVLGWLMGIVGFTAAWLACVVGLRSLALLVPLPIAALAGISVPDDQQVVSGLAVLVLFAIGLGILSSEQAGDDESRPSLAYEIRKSVKALPMIALITAGLYLLAQSNFLFPHSLIDPAQQPQKPKTQPLSNASDRVLFEISKAPNNDLVTGPFRTGTLDVYDGEFWRLPPFAARKLKEVPRSGIVDESLSPGLGAIFTVRGLTGAVLPSLPNPVGIIARGPKLAYDGRNGNVRLVGGTVVAGLQYTMTAAGLPKVSDLKAAIFTPKFDRDMRAFNKMSAAPPPAVQGLIDQAPKTSKWEQFDFLRRYILDNVTAKGTGTPVGIKPERIADMIAGSKKASPFEIVAAQAMLGRWIGVPTRIGYGFDGGEVVEDRLQVRPKNGAAFPEVNFPGEGWLPVIGQPKKAEPTVGSDPGKQQVDPNILPSNDIGVQVTLPILIPPKSVLTQQIAIDVLLLLASTLLAILIYFLYPALRKARLRGRRRDSALRAGTRARVALAYAEWRDYATDLGFAFHTDTPLMFTERIVDDDEHTELAWLTTRLLWGDLQDSDDPMYATIAEELSRSLRRRLGATQPFAVRFVASLSRLSLRHPYLTDTSLSARKSTRKTRGKTREPATV